MHLIVGTFASAFFCYLIYDRVSLSSLKHLFELLHLKTCIFALVLFLFSQLIKGFRWALLLSPHALKINSPSNILIFWQTNPLNSALPFRIGDILRVLLSQSQQSNKVNFALLIFEKFVDLSVIFLLFLVFFFISKTTSLGFYEYSIALGCLFVFFILVLSLKVLGFLVAKFKKIAFLNHQFLSHRILAIACVTLLGYLIDGLLVWLICRDLIGLDFLTAVQLNSVIGLTSVIPSLPFGIGVFQFFVGEFLNFTAMEIDGITISVLLNLFFVTACGLQFVFAWLIFGFKSYNRR